MKAAILEALYERPWNIEAGAWRSLHSAVSANLELSDFFVGRPEAEIDANGIGHVHATGVLGKHAPIAGILGDTDYDQLAEELQTVADDARAIMLHCNSPGGQAVGNEEAAEVFAGLDVPTLAFVDGICASAMFMIAVGADEIVATPSSLVGSIGCIIPFIDSEENWRAQGFKADYITSGDLKGAGFPPSLNDAQRAHLQEQVDDFFQAFRGHVLEHRLIENDAMQGQCFVAPRAASANLIDATGTQGEAYSWLLSRVQG